MHNPSTVQRGTTPGLAANELQEKLLREARLASSPLQRKLCEAAAVGMRMLSAQNQCPHCGTVFKDKAPPVCPSCFAPRGTAGEQS